MQIDITKTVRELTLEIPGATRVFERAGIDYCCGGWRFFQDACQAAEVQVDDVVRSLEQTAETCASNSESTDWRTRSLSELVSYIVGTHHSFTRDELSRLDVLLIKVCSAHGQNHPELFGIQTLFKELNRDLIPHMQKEERVLFPYIEQLEAAASAGKPAQLPFFGTAQNPIGMMMMEHEVAGDILARIRQASNNFTVPADGCLSYETLYKALAALEGDLHQHIHLENNVLFPRVVEMENANRAGNLQRIGKGNIG